MQTFEILSMLYDYERLKLQRLTAERRKYKAGNLVIRHRNGRVYYSEKSKGVEKGITKDKERTEQVIRSNYLQNEIKNTKIQMEAISDALGILKKISNKLEEELDDYHKIKCGYSLDDWKWMREPFQSNPLYPEHLQYVTKMGTVVRTKSELAIANALERNGIPYRYEQRIVVGGKVYYPDFTIRKPDGSIVIWEHNGAMDIEGYAEKAEERTNRYEEAGFRQHTNLIITYEDDIKSQEEIDKIIQRFVIF